MRVEFEISNAEGKSVETLMIRKFFQMVFIGNDRRSMHIYTATILGGNRKKFEKAADYYSELDSAQEFRIRFAYRITENDDNDIKSVSSENITSRNTKGNENFLDQLEYIKKIWGRGGECRLIKEDQQELLEYLEKVPKGESYTDIKVRECSAALTGRDVTGYYITGKVLLGVVCLCGSGYLLWVKVKYKDSLLGGLFSEEIL